MLCILLRIQYNIKCINIYIYVCVCVCVCVLVCVLNEPPHVLAHIPREGDEIGRGTDGGLGKEVEPRA